MTRGRIRHGAAAAGVALASGVLAVSGLAGPGDTKINRYKVGKFPIELAVGDFNRDGRKDLAVTNFQSTPKSISILRGRARGRFAPARTIPLPDGAQPDGIAVARFGSGRDQDLVVGTLGSEVLLFKGGSGASFTLSQPLVISGAPRDVATGDFNRDGLTDIAANRQEAGDVMTWLGTGGMAFGPADQNVGGGSRALVVARLDPGRQLDLASIDFLIDGVAVFRGAPDGTFGDAVPVMANTFPASLAVADLDRDGRNDVIAGLVGDRPRLAVSRGLPGGAFSAPVTLTVGRRAMVVQDIAVTRINRDRDPDLVLVGPQVGGIRAAHRQRRGGSDVPARVLFLKGRDGINLRRAREIRLAGNASAVTSARFDGGGRDVAVTAYPDDDDRRGKAVVIRNP